MSNDFDTLRRLPKVSVPFRKCAILFAGGPAPAANAVISPRQFHFAKRYRSRRYLARLLESERVRP